MAHDRGAAVAARFHELRSQALEGALAALAPKKPGRPKTPAVPPEIVRLTAENEELKENLWASQLREELALTVPHVLKRPGDGKKTGRRRTRS